MLCQVHEDYMQEIAEARITVTQAPLSQDQIEGALNRQEMVSGIPPKEKKTTNLTLTEEQLRNLALALMLGIPGVIGILGILICWVRRS